jgi:hypothetical protein
MKTFTLWWAPEGRPFAIVEAKTMEAAIRKVPAGYRKYIGEIYATEEVHERIENTAFDFRLCARGSGECTSHR